MIINANLLPNRILFINTNTNHHVSPVVAVGGVAVRKKSFGMYSALSAGVMFASISTNESVKQADPKAKDETLAAFMFQATALGIEFGGDFRGFVEAGLGEKGLLCAGLRYRF